MSFMNVLRVGALFLIGIITLFSASLFKKDRKNEDGNDLESFEKNEDGLYPWEINTDDSPHNIPSDATRFVEKDKIRRGRW